MKNEINYKISQILRGIINTEEIVEVLIKYYTLGYIEAINPQNSNIDRILRSIDVNKELENIFNQVSNEYKDLEGVFEHLNTDFKIPSQIKYEVLSIIKESNLNKDKWKLIIDQLIEAKNESSGKSSGESTTPKYLNKLGIGILEPIYGSFYDGTCGIGETLTEANDYAAENGNSIELYGQEINPKDWAICKIRLFVSGIDNNNIKLGNTLVNPLFTEGNKLKTFDNIMMNFPFCLTWKDEKEYVEKDLYDRFIFGKPPVSNAEWLFISHMIKSLNSNGKGIAITSSGTLFRGSSEETIRKNILSLDCIEAVISLPGVMTITAIPINMMVINMNKDEELKNKILFINAEDMYEVKGRNQKILTQQHIDSIIDIYKNRKEIEEISSIVNIRDIEGSNLLANKNVLKTKMISCEFGEVKFKKEKLEELKQYKTLGEIGKFFRGINVVPSNIEEDEQGEYKIVNLSDLNDSEIDTKSLQRYTIKNNARIESYSVKKGDILISSRGSNIKVCIVPEHDEKILISQNVIGFRLKGNNDSQYIKTFLESPLGEFLINYKQAGTNVFSLNSKDLMKIPVILLPEDEQRNIIEHYQMEYKKITEEIQQLNDKLKKAKLNLYEGMGITSTFEIM
ncbi:N-6 DNA methylase [Romboutsia timonensis]|jgi:type I restriction enzyme M protein|uniref:N-6 DNA methylase n=1 Tax=Romboutsia timonensis TaxID=1776391 RepID=UPI002A74C166|nr:N-6 DNA methylase [Romboutsia timonensis]MDY3002189.1 N-6 DNA methylase [Romboutsia timonensis]MDY3959723.1 N-6 DNA methylase [Romboutsia timonensis]